MVKSKVGGFVAECFWPDVNERDVRAVDARIAACIAGRSHVRYLGSILLREDEVVLCQFEGTETAVRDVVACAEVPFERLLTSTTYLAQGGSSA